MINKETVLVGVGGLVGAGARYSIGTMLSLPFFSTFIANLFGCLVIGCIYGLMIKRKRPSWQWALLATGFCGGFTTMSTFSMELVLFIQNGKMVHALLYLFVTLLFGIMSVFIGYLFSVKITPQKGAN